MKRPDCELETHVTIGSCKKLDNREDKKIIYAIYADEHKLDSVQKGKAEHLKPVLNCDWSTRCSNIGTSPEADHVI